MAALQEVYRADSLSSLEGVADQLDAQHFPSGRRGIFTIQFPWQVQDWMVTAAQDAASAAGVTLWQDAYADGGTLNIPFESHSPAIVAIVAAIPAILGAIATLVIIGAVLFIVYTLVETAHELGGSMGMLIALGAALIIVPNVISRSTATLQHNPRAAGLKRNPLDVGAVAGIGGIALLGAIGVEQAKKGALPGGLQDLAHSLFPSLPTSKGTTPKPSAPSAATHGDTGQYACFEHLTGNTRLTLSVAPSNPTARVGEAVTFTGRLTMTPPLVGWATGNQPVGNATVELWGTDCRRFDQVDVDTEGFFSLTRPLHANELAGYGCFAYYGGNPGLLRDPASTGVWNVIPRV